MFDVLKRWWAGKPAAAPPPTSVPVVSGKGQFDASLKQLLIWEGGKDDDPYDPGGRTAYGVIQREYNTRRTKQGLKPRDVWLIEPSEITAIYRENYWLPLKCDDYHPAVANVLFDYAVNSGNGQAVKDAQRILKCSPDGDFGPVTHAALLQAPPAIFVKALCARRLAMLHGLSTWWRFGKGWTARVEGVEKYSLSLVK